MSLYVALACMVIILVEPGLNPPGFQGTGAVGLLVVFAGSYRLGRRFNSPILFFLFGCLPAMFHIDLFLGSFEHREAFARTTDCAWKAQIARDTAACVAYVLAVGFLARGAALVAWKRSHRVAAGL
jgi:hypothetical protein